MNTIKTDNTGGFPLELETIKRMQEAYQQLQAFGALAGDKTIISGCKTIGSTVASGFIFLNDELLYFAGGSLQTNIVVKEVITEVEYADGNNKQTYFDRSASFGTGTGAIPWSDFKRVYPMASAVFIDKIDMYAGSIGDLPEGWFICDGQNGTVDLKGRFVVGLDPNDTDYNAVGKLGGAKEVALTESQMPVILPTGSISNEAHSHSYKDGYYSDNFNNKPTHGGGSEYNATSSIGSNDSDENNHYIYYKNRETETESHSHQLDINSFGNNEAHENRPPFYTLAYIQFKGF